MIEKSQISLFKTAIKLWIIHQYNYFDYTLKELADETYVCISLVEWLLQWTKGIIKFSFLKAFFVTCHFREYVSLPTGVSSINCFNMNLARTIKNTLDQSLKGLIKRAILIKKSATSLHFWLSFINSFN